MISGVVDGIMKSHVNADLLPDHDILSSISSKDRGRNPALQQMIEACSSITRRALSCPTLGSYGMLGDLNQHDTVDSTKNMISVAAEDAYADEVEVAKWLDSQIIDYKAALLREAEGKTALSDSSERTEGTFLLQTSKAAGTGQFRQGKARSADSSICENAKRKRPKRNEVARKKERMLKTLREDLFDETVRAQQERLLLSRLRSAAAAVRTSFPVISKSTASTGDNDPEGEEIFSRCLRREALRDRDSETVSALGKIKQVEILRAKLETTNAECRELQSKARNLWQRFNGVAPKAIMTEGNDSLYESDESATLSKENVVLRRALAEAIATSGIDWYYDERLTKIMASLGE